MKLILILLLIGYNCYSQRARQYDIKHVMHNGYPVKDARKTKLTIIGDTVAYIGLTKENNVKYNVVKSEHSPIELTYFIYIEDRFCGSINIGSFKLVIETICTDGKLKRTIDIYSIGIIRQGSTLQDFY